MVSRLFEETTQCWADMSPLQKAQLIKQDRSLSPEETYTVRSDIFWQIYTNKHYLTLFFPFSCVYTHALLQPKIFPSFFFSPHPSFPFFFVTGVRCGDAEFGQICARARARHQVDGVAACTLSEDIRGGRTQTVSLFALLLLFCFFCVCVCAVIVVMCVLCVVCFMCVFCVWCVWCA